MRKHVADAGLRVMNGTDLASRAEVVVVASHRGRSLRRSPQRRAGRCAGARSFLATGRDPTYPQPDGPWPGTGAILAAVEYASGRSAEIVGKPEPQLFQTALDRLGEGRTLVVGDRLDSDVAAAANAGLDAALVLSGGTKREDMDGARPEPIAVADDLSQLLSR